MLTPFQFRSWRVALAAACLIAGSVAACLNPQPLPPGAAGYTSGGPAEADAGNAGVPSNDEDAGSGQFGSGGGDSGHGDSGLSLEAGPSLDAGLPDGGELDGASDAGDAQSEDAPSTDAETDAETGDGGDAE